MTIPSRHNDRMRLSMAVARGMAILLLTSAGLVGTGCRSLNEPASARFASVQIGGGRTDLQIRVETIKVFEENGFEALRTADEMLFEKEGTYRDELAYGNSFVGDEKPVRIRVRAQIVPLGGGLHRLQCTAHAVRPFGGGEDEVKLPFYRRGSYRDMLKEVSSRLTDVKVIQK